MTQNTSPPRRKISPRIRDLQTRLLKVIPPPASDEETSTGQPRWTVTQQRGQQRVEHPASLTGRQLVDSDQSDGPQPPQGRRAKLERSKIITKHWERPDLFVRHEDPRRPRRTLFGPGDDVSDMDEPDRAESAQRWVRNFDHVPDVPAPHEAPDLYSRSWDPSRDERRNATWDPARASRSRTDAALERAARERLSCRTRSRDPTPEAHRDSSRTRRTRDPTPDRSRRPLDDPHRAPERSRHRSGDRGRDRSREWSGDRGRDRSREWDWSWDRSRHRSQSGDRLRAESGDRLRAQSGDRLRAPSVERVSDGRDSRSRRRAPDEPPQRRSKSVVRFDEASRDSERRRRSRSSEQVLSGGGGDAPRRASALRKSCTTASSSGSRGARVSFVELGDGTVLTGDWDSGDETDSAPTVAPDLLDRFFFPSDGYLDDYFRQQQRAAGPTSLPTDGRRTERPRHSGPGRPHGEQQQTSRRYRRHRTPDRNNNNRYRAKSEARVAPSAPAARPASRSRVPDGAHTDYRRSWDAIGDRAPTRTGRRARVQFGEVAVTRDLDQVNCNPAGVLDELYEELERFSRQPSVRSSSRRAYASLDVGSMGVDLGTGPAIASDFDENVVNNNMGRRTGGGDGAADPLTGETVPPDLIGSLDDNRRLDSDGSPKQQLYHSSADIPHFTGELTDDLYALPVKRGGSADGQQAAPTAEEQPTITLPAGWERHEDNDGPYYWHIKSGTIQREPPPTPANDDTKPPVKDSESSSGISSGSAGSGVTRSSTSSALADLDRRHVDYADKRKSYPARMEEADSRRVRFAVRSLGWVEIAEVDLTPDRSSKAVNQCIVDLSLGRNDVVSDSVGRWGDGKGLFMDLDEGSLKLLDPDSQTLLNTQPIHTIRVWGVGRDNGKDFAYVARDRTTRKHMCHVFRCETPARVISNTLRDICKKIMIERSLAQSAGRLSEPGLGGPAARLARPTSLAVDQRRALKAPQPPLTLGSQSFPTPMEEPKRTLQALYMGCTPVPKPSGIDVLNQALTKLCGQSSPAEWRSVNVSVAPSTVWVNDAETDEQVVECRVRFLSFLGIGKDVQQCGIIVHTSQDVFIAHGFSCSTSAGPLCKTIEAACKLRYQKCLDALPGGGAGRGAPAQSRSFGQTLKSVIGSLAGRRLRSMDS